jgi:hypothetical protein
LFSVQLTKLLVPIGQKVPGGHRMPVTMSVGEAVAAPEIHQKPAVQLPVGAMFATPWQYLPASHAMHWLSAVKPVCELYVPAGQEGGGEPEPSGQ